MKKVNLKNMELLGCDYARRTEVYLNHKNGDIFIRKTEMVAVPSKTKGGKAFNRIDVSKSIIFKAVPVEIYEDATPVLTRDN